MASKNNINSVFTDIANSIRAKKGTTNTIQPINMAEEIDGIITGIDGVEAYNGDASHILITKPKSYISINENVEQLAINKNASIIVDSQDGTGLVNVELNSGTINIDGVSYVLGAMTFTESALVNTLNIEKEALTINLSSYDHIINVNSADTTINVNNGQTDITNNESGVINLDNKGSLTIASNSGNVTAENLTPENIKEGVSILGKVGTFKGGSSEDRLKKLLDTTKSANYLFYEYKGTSVDNLIQYSDTENVTSTERMFYGCNNLQSIPLLDTSNVTNTYGMLTNCYNLQTIQLLNMIKVSNATSMFYMCENLTNLTLLNIKVNLTIGSGTSYGHLLTLESLINTIMELWNYKGSSSTYKLTMGSANLEKIANTYVLVTDETTDKMTAEVCDSTTEGAITLQAFAELKGWALQ